MASRVTSLRRRRPTESVPVPVPPSDLLAHRCRQFVRRGRLRQATQALRELANRDQQPAVWVRLGALLARCERADASIDALKQGRWLHQRNGQVRRADVVSELISQVERGERSGPRGRDDNPAAA